MQILIKPGAGSPHPFCDHARLIASLADDQRVIAIGRSNDRLIKAGVIGYGDIVLPDRIRSVTEVVAAKRIPLKALKAAGLSDSTAERIFDEARSATGRDWAASHRERLADQIAAARAAHAATAKHIGAATAQRPSKLAPFLMAQPPTVAPTATPPLAPSPLRKAAELTRMLGSPSAIAKAKAVVARVAKAITSPFRRTASGGTPPTPGPRQHAPVSPGGTPKPVTSSLPLTPAAGSLGERIRKTAAWERAQSLASIGRGVAEKTAEVDRLFDQQKAVLGRLQASPSPAVEAELRATNIALKAAQADLRIAADEAAVRAARRLATPGEKVAWTHEFETDNPSLDAEIGKARRFVEGLVNRTPDRPESINLKWKSIPKDEEQRSFAASGGRLTFLGHDANIPTVVHEWGHHVETELQGLARAANEFLEYRCKGEVPRPMSVLMKSNAYGSSELGREDEFGRAFGPLAGYVGKKCIGDVTEVVSMGLEQLYNDAAGFAHADPEYVAWLLAHLSGEPLP